MTLWSRRLASEKTILVTGASGFIGGRVVETLYLRGFGSIRAGIRQWSSGARIARFPVDIVLCDVMDQEQVNKAMRGSASVIHCVLGDAQTNIQGTRNLLDAAIRLGVQRFVHLSTAEIYGDDVYGRLDETSPYQYTGWDYTDSKIEAEKLCWDYLAKGLSVTILRPSIVYGPFSKQWVVGFAKRLQSGNWGKFKDYGEGICNLVYVDDLVSAILLAEGDEKAIGEAFNVNGPETITWNGYFQRYNAALGLPELREIGPARARLMSCAVDFATSLAGYIKRHGGDSAREGFKRIGGGRIPAIKRVMKKAKQSVRTAPSPRELRCLFSRNVIYVCTKVQDVLGYDPNFDIDAGLQMSVSWLKHHGYLS